MESILSIAIVTLLSIASLRFFAKIKKADIDYSSLDLYAGKTFREICQSLGSPFLSEKQLSGFKSTWLLKDQRITLCFNEDLLFASVLSFSRLPKAVKSLPACKKTHA